MSHLYNILQFESPARVRGFELAIPHASHSTSHSTSHSIPLNIHSIPLDIPLAKSHSPHLTQSHSISHSIPPNIPFNPTRRPTQPYSTSHSIPLDIPLAVTDCLDRAVRGCLCHRETGVGAARFDTPSFALAPGVLLPFEAPSAYRQLFHSFQNADSWNPTFCRTISVSFVLSRIIGDAPIGLR